MHNTDTRAKIDRYTSHYGVNAALYFFPRKLDKPISKSTIHSIHKAYVEEVTRRRQSENIEEINVITVLYKGHDRPVLLGEELDINVQL